MLCSFSRLFKRLSRRALQGATLLAVAAKLLVPLGYMPGALADGGPIVLCPAGLPPGFRVTLAVAGNADRHASHAELAASAPDADGRAASGARDDALSGPGPDGSAPTHDHADGAPWERCTLGGLAGLVPLAFSPTLVDTAPGPDTAPVFAAAPASERTVTVVRSRGPPSRSG